MAIAAAGYWLLRLLLAIAISYTYCSVLTSSSSHHHHSNNIIIIIIIIIIL